MKKKVKDIDRQFTEHYKNLLDIQKNVYKELCDYQFDLEDSEITQSVIERMDAFWHFNCGNKDLLERKINPVAADFFTETVLLFVKSYFSKYSDVKVLSEANIKNLSEANIKVLSETNNESVKKSIRPDISIWKGDELIGVLELKVSNGWKGKYIIGHLQEREVLFKRKFSNCYFGVLAFWNFFDHSSPEWNVKYVGLKNWKSKKDQEETDGRIEKLIEKIEENLNKSQ